MPSKTLSKPKFPNFGAMFRLSLRTLSSITPSRSLPPYSIFTARCSTSWSPRLTYPHSFTHPMVSVWWDLDNCNVPSGLKAFKGYQAIRAAIESSGIKGPIEITAFGDMCRHAKTTRQIGEALPSTTAIEFRHIPYDPSRKYKRGSADRFLVHDLLFWVLVHPPPVHLFLVINGCSASILYHLRKRNYNILLANKESAPGLLSSAATIVWNWDALVRGENLTGRYFNQPPNCSWYGHYEGPHPFTEFERTSYVPDDQPGEVQTPEGKDGILLSEKKWVRESPYLSRPFKHDWS